MKVNRSAAVSLLVELGAAMASKWTTPKMLGKLKKIDELVDSGTTLEKDNGALLKQLQKANEAEEDIEIEDDEEGDKPSKKDKKKDKGEKSEKEEKPSKKDKKKGKRPTTAAAADAPRDAFGNREGTQAAAINAVMTRKSQEVKEIAEASGFSNARVKGHLAFLVEHGYAEKTSKGYKLTGKTRKSAGKDEDDTPAKAKPTKKVKKVKPEAEEEGGDSEDDSE